MDEMKRTMKNVIYILASVMLLSACNGFLSPDRDNIYDGDKILNYPDKAEGVLLSAYSKLPGGVNFTDVATADAVSNNNGNSYRKITNGEWSSQNNPLSVWDNAYEAIAFCNHFLDRIVENVRWSDSEWVNANYIKRLTAEARGLRAFFYIQLLESHAGIGTSGRLLGVPMIMNDINVSEADMPRLPYDECLEYILRDLAFAEENLPVEYADAGPDVKNPTEYNQVYGVAYRNRFCGIIAKMLKAKALYNAACPAFNLDNDKTKWADAADAAAEVIDFHGGLAGLKPDRVKYWNYSETDNSGNTDLLWRKNFYNANAWESDNFPPSLFGSGRVNPSQNIVDAFPAANGWPIDSEESGYDKNAPYSNRDPRLASYIVRNGSKLKDRTINTVDDLSDGVDRIANESTRSGYYLRKLLNEASNLDPGNKTNSRHYATLLRYTEAYLIYAEAACNAYGMTGKDGHDYSAKDVMAAIRQSAGLAQPDSYLESISSDGEMLSLVGNERRIEYCFEGYRFWDIRKHKDIAAMNETAKGTKDGGITVFDVETRTFNDYMIYGPIPYPESQKGLEQNKGWR